MDVPPKLAGHWEAGNPGPPASSQSMSPCRSPDVKPPLRKRMCFLGAHVSSGLGAMWKSCQASSVFRRTPRLPKASWNLGSSCPSLGLASWPSCSQSEGGPEGLDCVMWVRSHQEPDCSRPVSYHYCSKCSWAGKWGWCWASHSSDGCGSRDALCFSQHSVIPDS